MFVIDIILLVHNVVYFTYSKKVDTGSGIWRHAVTIVTVCEALMIMHDILYMLMTKVYTPTQKLYFMRECMK